MSQKRILLIALVGLVGVFTLGCEEDADNKLASAQQCLDKINSNASLATQQAAALVCESKVNGLTSSESYVIRCATRFIIGGITSARMIDAVQAMDSVANNLKAAKLMIMLSQEDSTKANDTYQACKKSGVSSFDYFATISLTGTAVSGGSAAVGGAGNLDGVNPTTALAACVSGGCDDAAIGAAVHGMYGSYCIGDTANSDVCKDINQAITNGSSDADIAHLLYQYLQN